MRTLLKLLFGLTLVGLIVISSAAIFETFITSKEVEIEITKLERTLNEEGELKYFIHTKEEVFRNEDNYYHGKSNQESLMKLLEANKKYKVQVVGYNLGFEIPFFISSRRNIIKIIR